MSFNRTVGSGPTRKQRREQARDARRANEAAQRRASATRRRLTFAGGVTIALLAGISVSQLSAGEGAPGGGAISRPQLRLAPLASLGPLRPPGEGSALGPEEVPIPVAPSAATVSTKAAGRPVNGIACSTREQTLFHIHAHLTIFVHGAPRVVPYGIGIPNARVENTAAGPFVTSGTCFYWLHTHAADGIVHIESPIQRVFSLGDFFDVWGQPLSPTQVGPVIGPVTAIYDGQRYLGDPRLIPLTAHAQIQLDVGRPWGPTLKPRGRYLAVTVIVGAPGG